MALKVLLADDSVPAQNMGKKILTDAGYEVLAVSNGLEALKKIADSVPDIAILDIFMPGYTGLEVCSRLRANAVTAELPVILTVGKLEPYRPEDGEKVHSSAVIVKPFASEELVSAVRSLVGLPFAIRPEPPEVKTPPTPSPASTPEPEDEYQEEAPMLAGIGFEPIGFDPDAKRTAFSASAAEEAPATSARMMPAFEAAAFSALSDFEIEPATATAPSTAATATALVEWWQPTPEPVEELHAAELELAGEVEPPAVAANSAVPATAAILEAALESPATLPKTPSPAIAAVADDSAERAAASVAEAPAPDRESRMQAFEALFNSDEAMPVEANPAALPDLLAQEELEVSLEDEPEALSLLAMEDGPGEGLPIASAASAATKRIEMADDSDELQLDADSIPDWLAPTKDQSEPEPPAATAEKESTDEPAHACNSFSAGLPDEAELPQANHPADGSPDTSHPSTSTEVFSEVPQTAAGEAASPMVCYLPKEEATEPARESFCYASLQSEATGFARPETVTAQSEDEQIEVSQAEVQEYDASKAFEPEPESEEELAPGVMQQMTSEFVQSQAESARAVDENVDEGETLATAISPGGDAKRIHQAVESVFDRFRPLLIAAIARELTKRD